MIVSQSVFNHKPKPRELNMLESKYSKNEDYTNAYKMRAMYLKSKAIINGIRTDAVVSLGIFFPLIVIFGGN